jgi:carboxylate-amine ligase
VSLRTRFVPDPRPAWAREPSGLTAADCARAFSDTDAYTVGLEEELMLLDPETLDLTPAIERVYERVAGDRRFAKELRASMIETVSPVCRDAAEAQGELHRARADLFDAVDGLVCIATAGTHPRSSRWGDITPGDRYAVIADLYPWAALRGMMCGLHVHVAVGDAKRALAVYNAIRSYGPELSALGANSPFFEGRDTGLASIRPILNEAFPRAGTPPRLESWSDFVDLLDWGRRGGSFPDATFLWWEIRPHPHYGTIELRIPDAATKVEDAGALAALAQCLVAWLGDRHDGGEQLPAHDSFRIGENSWSAQRYGLDGWLLDLDTGEAQPTRERIHALLGELHPVAQRLGCTGQLEHARTLLVDNGAERQRYVHAREGMDGLLRWLVAATHPGDVD